MFLFYPHASSLEHIMCGIIYELIQEFNFHACMNNSSRGKKALAGLITLTAFLMSAFIIPEKVYGAVVSGTAARDTYAIGSARFLKATLLDKKVLLSWRPDIPPVVDTNASYFTVIYRSEGDQNHFQKLITIPTAVNLFSDGDPSLKEEAQYFYKVAYGRIRVPAEIYGGRAGSPAWDVQGPVSNVVGVTIPKLAAPREVVLNANQSPRGMVDLTWNTYDGVFDFTLSRKEGDGLFKNIATKLTGTAYTDTQVELGKKYTYIIVPRTLSGLGTSSNIAEIAITPSINSSDIGQDPRPVNPTNLRAQIKPRPFGQILTNSEVSFLPENVYLTWDPSPERVDYYKIYRAKDLRYVKPYDNKYPFYYEYLGRVPGNQTNFVWSESDSLSILRYRVVAERNNYEGTIASAPEVKLMYPSRLYPIELGLPPENGPFKTSDGSTTVRLVHQGETLYFPYTYTNHTPYGVAVTLTEQITTIPNGQIVYTAPVKKLDSLISPKTFILQPGEKISENIQYYVGPAGTKGIYGVKITAQMRFVQLPGGPDVPQNLKTTSSGKNPTMIFRDEAAFSVD